MSETESMLDKWDRVSEDALRVSDFLAWLSEQKLFICNLYDNPDRWLPTMDKHDTIIDKYFGIDQNQLEKERRNLLDDFRKLQ